MKLVEIKDIRHGQIRKNYNDTILIVEIKSDGFSYYRKYDEFGNLVNTDVKINIKFLDMPVIGFLGITHEIKDNKLVEIPREEFELDDVVEIQSEKGALTDIVRGGFNNGIVTYFYNTFLEKTRLKKIGILGVTHEFINERLAK